MFDKATVRGLLAATVVASAVSVQADVFNMPSGQTSLQFVTVGDPGNLADTTGYGSVPYVYQMGKYDVTVGQYCQFLNAVAKTDTYGLYNPEMATDLPTIQLDQSGNPGNYSYSVTGNCSQGVNCPIFDVSWGDAARFCNWLQNGQPTGPEGNGTTETGSYALNGGTSQTQLMAVTRSSTATYVIPTENEWYKASFYSGGGTNAGYWLYPTQSNSPPGDVLSATGTNNANFAYNNGYSAGYTDPTNYLTPVGSFVLSPGPYGTYDMGGNVFQWNEAVYNNGLSRAFFGGSWGGGYGSEASWALNYDSPTLANDGLGFRVASVPEPSTLALLIAGAVGLLAIAWRRSMQAT